MLAAMRKDSAAAQGLLSSPDLRRDGIQEMATDAPYRIGRGRLVAWLAFVLLLAAIGYAGQAEGSELPEDFAYRYSEIGRAHV